MNKFLLLLIVPCFGSNSRASRRGSAGILYSLAKGLVQQRFNVTPGPHIPGFFLAPDQFGGVTHLTDRFLKTFQIQGVELFDTDERGITYSVRFHVSAQIVVDLSAAENDPVNVLGFAEQRRPQNRLKSRIREIFDPGS